MNPELSGPAAPLPPSPFVLLDPVTVEQAGAALARLEGWLSCGDPGATAECAHACSAGQDDAVGVARWVGALAARLQTRIEETNSWS